jgi:hypothetical protein
MQAPRFALAVIATAAAAWFVIGARQAHEIDTVSVLLNHQAGNNPATSRRAASLLNSADFLYPGVDVTLLRARLDMERHDYPKAKPLVDRSLASEPGNLNAWISALDLAIVQPSAENTKRIVAHLQALDPIDFRSFAH